MPLCRLWRVRGSKQEPKGDIGWTGVSTMCLGWGGSGHTGKEREHVWEGSTHPEGEVELGDREKCEENACAGAETA